MEKLIIRILVLLYMCVCVSGVYLFPATCYPNGTLQTINPNPGVLVSVFAVQNEGGPDALICTATMDGAIITVTGCDINQEINIFMSDRPASDGMTFVGGNWVSYCTFCSDIADSGVDRTVVNLFRPTLPVTTLDSITPSFTVSSALRETGPDGPVAFSAIVGDPLWLTIDIPSDYSGLPTCTAYSGTDSSGSPSKSLFSDGCLQDADLFDSHIDNEYNSIPGTKRLWAKFYVFKFYNSDDVFIECSVKLCPPSSLACILSCSKRRRRFSGEIPQADEVDKFFRTSSLLHITTEENSGSFSIGSIWLVAVSLLVVTYRAM